MTHLRIPAVTAVALMLGAGQAIASEKPPSNAMPLSEIASSLENQGYSPIVEMSIDDGLWEIEAYRADVKRELKVSPQTGEIMSDKPDN